MPKKNDDSPKGTKTERVDCAKSKSSIQKKVDKVKRGRPTTILIKGICNEEITVTKDDVTLLAHEDGGTVNGSIYVIDAKRVTIDGLKVTGSADGVGALDHASVTIKNAILEDNRGSGVLAARSALVTLRDNVIRLNDEYGVLVLDGANAQIRAGNTIESDVAGAFAGSPIGGFRNVTIRIRDGGNIIRNNATSPPSDPQDSNTATGIAIDVEHGSILRQDSGDATIIGHIYVFNLTSADFRQADIAGHIFIDGLASNFRLRNSTVTGGMNMFGEATFRSNVIFTGDINCNFQFISGLSQIGL